MPSITTDKKAASKSTGSLPKPKKSRGHSLRDLAAKARRERRAPLPSTSDFMERLQRSGWWDTLSPAQKKLALSLSPEASGQTRPRIRPRKRAT